MKKSYRFIILSLVLLCSSLTAYTAESNDESINKIALKNIGIAKFENQDPKKEIINIFNLHATYSSTHNIEELKKLYAESYINNDGFNKKIFFELIEKSWELYPNIEYLTEIDNMSIDGDYACVGLKETAKGITKDPVSNIPSTGTIYSDSYTYYNLQKIGPSWKITSSSVIKELTYLKYGNAKDLQIHLSAPNLVNKNAQYTAELSTDVPANSFILASITNEPIIYPQTHPKEVFRGIRRNKPLERVLTANSDNCNEYAVASLGITKTNVSADDKISLDLSGMAFIMTRVNVVSHTPIANKELKEKTDINNNEKN